MSDPSGHPRWEIIDAMWPCQTLSGPKKKVRVPFVSPLGAERIRCNSKPKKAPFSKTSTELPATAVLSVRPASEGINSSIGELHSMCSLGSR